MTTRLVLPAMLLALASTPALASPASQAQAHFRAIAAGRVHHIMQQYADGATFQWIGGPLNGFYSGRDSIDQVWRKFSKAVAPDGYRAWNVSSAVNPDGTTVTADVEFKGRKNIKVRYVLVYRANKLVNEIWQIDPGLKVG
ncbi:MAG: nuclear transport factor 2 family protein [Gammaproteobacteria bacterium]